MCNSNVDFPYLFSDLPFGTAFSQEREREIQATPSRRGERVQESSPSRRRHGIFSVFFPGDGHPTFNRESYNGYINPYYWVDDHPLLYGNNGGKQRISMEHLEIIWK